jgi:hypothetical protein
VPNFGDFVWEATAASVVNASNLGFAVTLSPTQIESYPLLSTCLACSIILSKFGFVGEKINSPRVARSMPIFSFDKISSRLCESAAYRWCQFYLSAKAIVVVELDPLW